MRCQNAGRRENPREPLEPTMNMKPNGKSRMEQFSCESQKSQAACATSFLALPLGHAPGVNSPISVIMAPGKRENKSFR